MNIFEQAIDLHTHWRLRITKDIIEGAVIDTSDIGNCHACELGAWIYSHGLKYNNLASFEAMCSRHEHFHRAAAEVAQCGNAGETTRAMALLSPGGVFDQTSLMLIASLKECSKELDLTEEEPCPIVRVSDILERKDDKRIYCHRGECFHSRRAKDDGRRSNRLVSRIQEWAICWPFYRAGFR